MQRHRVMVIGNNVMTVQQISRYCLTQSIEIFPYYEVPTHDEIVLFNPHVIIICSPVTEDFISQISRPYILWSDQATHLKTFAISNLIDLKERLQSLLNLK